MTIKSGSNVNPVIAGEVGSAACTGTLSAGGAYYYVVYEAASNTYEIDVRQESASNCTKLTNDNGDSNRFIEVGTTAALDLMTDI